MITCDWFAKLALIAIVATSSQPGVLHSQGLSWLLFPADLCGAFACRWFAVASFATTCYLAWCFVWEGLTIAIAAVLQEEGFLPLLPASFPGIIV